MFIKSLTIKNYRSIKDLTLEPANLCALIGPNSVGKTNILKALNILLGEIYPTERAFKKEDFFNEDTNKTISIQVNFAEPLGEFKLTSKDSRQKENCSPISLRITHTKNPNEFFRTQFIAITANQKEYWGNGDVRESISFLYIPSERDLEKQMTTSQWALLGKILNKINENFSQKQEGEELNEREKKFREAMKLPRKVLESDFGTEKDVTYAKFKKLFVDTCSEMAGGLADSFELDLEIYDPLFYYKTVQIIGNEIKESYNIQELGSGVQNLVLLALVRTYASLFKGRVVLAIEEPEIFLYPQAQRHLYDHFRSLAYLDKEKSTQIFYTTHNPNFVDAYYAKEIEILRKLNNKGTINFEKNEEYLTAERVEKEKFRIYTHFNSERNELFFAQKIIFVEGDSDKILWTTLCENRWNINLNKEGVSIIECGGKGGVNYFVGVCNLMGLQNYFAIWDQDSDGDYNPKKNCLKGLVANGNGLEIINNLEKFLGLPDTKNSQKVKNAFEWAVNESNKIPKEFEVVKNFLQDTKNDTQLEADENIPF
ncbi:ATP-dependent endonuclease [Patescibacteria group bacterium]